MAGFSRSCYAASLPHNVLAECPSVNVSETPNWRIPWDWPNEVSVPRRCGSLVSVGLGREGTAFLRWKPARSIIDTNKRPESTVASASAEKR